MTIRKIIVKLLIVLKVLNFEKSRNKKFDKWKFFQINPDPISLVKQELKFQLR